MDERNRERLEKNEKKKKQHTQTTHSNKGQKHILLQNKKRVKVNTNSMYTLFFLSLYYLFPLFSSATLSLHRFYLARIEYYFTFSFANVVYGIIFISFYLWFDWFHKHLWFGCFNAYYIGPIWYEIFQWFSTGDKTIQTTKMHTCKTYQWNCCLKMFKVSLANGDFTLKTAHM